MFKLFRAYVKKIRDFMKINTETKLNDESIVFRCKKNAVSLSEVKLLESQAKCEV